MMIDLNSNIILTLIKKINLSLLLLPVLCFGPWGELPIKQGEPRHQRKDKFKVEKIFVLKKLYLNLKGLAADEEPGHHEKR